MLAAVAYLTAQVRCHSVMPLKRAAEESYARLGSRLYSAMK